MTHAHRPTLHLIDGSGYIFRAYYAIRPLTTRAGVPTHAVVGFAKMLNKLLREMHPKALGIAFDTKDKTFRHHMYAEYKGNRQLPPEDLIPQFALIHELVEALNIPLLKISGYEADDLLATLAKKAVSQGYKVVVVTGDKDLMQLVDEHITLYDPMKDKHIDAQAVEAYFGVQPNFVTDILGLAGDTSDNIPGVPKVGPKSAAKMVQQFGHLDAIIEGLQQQDKRKAFEQAIVAHVEQAKLSKRLATLAYDAPIELEPEKLSYSAPDAPALLQFLHKIEAPNLIREFGLHTDNATQDAQAPLAQIQATAPEAATPIQSQQHTQACVIDRTRYQTVTTHAQLQQICTRIQDKKSVTFDLETTSLTASEAEIVGVALALDETQVYYIPLRHHYLGMPKQIPASQALETLRPIFEDASIAKSGQNLKYDFVVLHRIGIHVKNIAHDSMLAAYVLDSDRLSYSLDTLAHDILEHENISYQTLTGTKKNKIPFYEVEVQAATAYAGEDADVSYRLCQIFTQQLQTQNLTQLYQDLEMPLLPILATMEAHGILVDLPYLKTLGDEFVVRLQQIEAEAFAHIGRPINLASPKQLGQLFFEELGYPVVKKTKTGYSTDQSVLEILAKDHALPKIILEHRLLAKLKSTYVDALSRLADPKTHRVHTHFNQTGTATGRLSSSEPNLQNIPIRGEDGRRIRSAFIAQQGWEIITADYSQIELRVLAHLSNDPQFIEAFHRNEDIHHRTAVQILTHGQAPDAEARRRAKAINFGIIYGLSEFGLSKQLGISRQDARAYITAYFQQYPQIRAFMDATIAAGRKQGFVTTLLGRRRFINNLNSQNTNLRQAAERIAMNTPVQGTAADLIKLAMLAVSRRLTQEQLQARLLLQVHDELLIEAPCQERDRVRKILEEEMTQVYTLRVPLTVAVYHGDNWAKAH